MSTRRQPLPNLLDDPAQRPDLALLTERTGRVVAASKLRRSAGRKKAGHFLAEGPNAVSTAFVAHAVVELFVTETGRMRFADLLAQASELGVPIHTVTERAAFALSDTVTPPGIVAVCPLLSPVDSLPAAPRLVAVPVEMREPGNAGTLIRVADAMGADAVLLAGDCVDPHNGKAVRASAGSVFNLPILRNHDVAGSVDMLRSHGLQICATAADGEVSLHDAAHLLTQPTAWLFGSEAHGLSKPLQRAADYRIRIPISGRAESLNLATAASICLYESARSLTRGDTI